ncbi:unnamed protein product [Ectocarpus sp. 8 AP-2014]
MAAWCTIVPHFIFVAYIQQTRVVLPYRAAHKFQKPGAKSHAQQVRADDDVHACLTHLAVYMPPPLYQTTSLATVSHTYFTVHMLPPVYQTTSLPSAGVFGHDKRTPPQPRRLVVSAGSNQPSQCFVNHLNR